jgi:hypothetical protein
MYEGLICIKIIVISKQKALQCSAFCFRERSRQAPRERVKGGKTVQSDFQKTLDKSHHAWYNRSVIVCRNFGDARKVRK